jgi:hypothetical protein
MNECIFNSAVYILWLWVWDMAAWSCTSCANSVYQKKTVHCFIPSYNNMYLQEVGV